MNTFYVVIKEPKFRRGHYIRKCVFPTAKTNLTEIKQEVERQFRLLPGGKIELTKLNPEELTIISAA